MSAGPLRNCPKEVCPQKKWGHGRVKKKISGGAGLLFKGSGFYITDYRSQKYKDAAKKESTAPVKPAATESKSTPAASPPPAKSGKG